MSEEEKKLVEKFKNLYIKDFNGEPIIIDDRLSYIECALLTNLIEKLEKELNSLKEIEQLHKEENGKLRVELEQEKEKNIFLEGFKVGAEEAIAELEEKLKIATAMLTRGTYPEQNEGDNDFDKQFISKDKIKEKRDELICKERTSKLEMGNLYRYGIAVLNSVLEEKQ